MPKTTKTLTELAEGKLENDEKILIGIRVNLKGTAFGVGFSTINISLGSEMMNEGEQQAKDSGIPFSQQMALGLTEKRIIIWKRSAFSGKPKDIIGFIPLEQIKAGEFEKVVFGDIIRLNFKNDKVLELESIKIDNGKGFIEKLNELLN